MTTEMTTEKAKNDVMARDVQQAARAIATNAKRIASALSPQQVEKLMKLQDRVDVAKFELQQVQRDTESAVAALFESF